MFVVWLTVCSTVVPMDRRDRKDIADNGPAVFGIYIFVSFPVHMTRHLILRVVSAFGFSGVCGLERIATAATRLVANGTVARLDVEVSKCIWTTILVPPEAALDPLTRIGVLLTAFSTAKRLVQLQRGCPQAGQHTPPSSDLLVVAGGVVAAARGRGIATLASTAGWKMASTCRLET